MCEEFGSEDRRKHGAVAAYICGWWEKEGTGMRRSLGGGKKGGTEMRRSVGGGKKVERRCVDPWVVGKKGWNGGVQRVEA